jgi:hypothetical protein
MNVAQLKALKANNINAYRALSAMAMTVSYTKEYGSPATQKARACAFGDAYKAVKAALVGYEFSFWVNEKFLLDWHKFDRKIAMLPPWQRKRVERRLARRGVVIPC